MDELIKIFSGEKELAEALAADLINSMREAESTAGPYTVALSGGNTPQLLFNVLSEKYSGYLNRSHVHLFWVDERCVHKDDPDSNFGSFHKLIKDKIKIPDSHIHRIRGENDPEKEASRYSEEVIKFTRSENGLPAFDYILLGIGSDGHTASIFPSDLKVFESDRICEVTLQPQSGQKRVTLTGKVLNNASEVSFMVTGGNKSVIVDEILNNKDNSVKYPASWIKPENGKLTWWLDEKAALLI